MAAGFGVSQVLSNNPLCAVDTTFCKSPLYRSEFDLCLFCILSLPTNREIEEFDARLGDNRLINTYK
jgi:hypothetical protein